MLVGLVVWLIFMSADAYAIWPFTRESDGVSYFAPCWGENNKIYFIKKVTHGTYIAFTPFALLQMGRYSVDKIEYYLCSMNYDGTEKKEIKEIMTERKLEKLKEQHKKKYGKEWDGTSRLETYMSFSKSAQRLVYCVKWGIWSIDVAGTEERFLDWDGLHPSFSPDGKKIVYQMHVKEEKRREDGWLEGYENYDSIWIMDIDGSNKHKIFSGRVNESVTSPIWSPKDDLIAFVSQGWIWVMKPDGSERRRVIKGDVMDWCPDGSKLFVCSGWFKEGRGIVDLDGNPIKGIYAWGKWSSDGKMIIGERDFELRDANGKELKYPFSGVSSAGANWAEGKHFKYKKPDNIW